MCGRYTAVADLREVVTTLGVDEVIAALDEPRFNIAPTQQVSAVIQNDNHRQLDLFSWGLQLPWTKLAPSNLINARIESVTEKPSFREAIRYRRCLIPASGWYEWQSTMQSAGRKQPFYFYSKTTPVLAFAGIYELAEDNSKSLAIITQSADEVVSPIHDRMPFILSNRDFSTWLDPNLTDGEFVLKKLGNVKPPALLGHAVSTEVNSARSQGAHLIAPSKPQPAQPTLFD
jgi:putative SOS response-associated peptidase YedK